ncbi:MAG: hypothetical protein BWY22_02037 [Bacteroidetes bacterium ADurb.Bin217]|nr:MAG: hypothetical protein BWY22_02037 [Bacteroidetes bacterium ADurb.Bin217]
MNKFFIITSILFCFISSSFAQNEDYYSNPGAAITFGILQGGGGLLGVDLEYLLTERLGAQVGLGYVSFGASINYHLKPTIHSSFISLQYWKQGFNDSFAQDLLGTSFVFRAKKLFTCQIGLGKILKRGPAYPSNLKKTSFILLYSIGIYLPT